MTRNSALKILNPIIGLLMLNQLLTSVFHESISNEIYELLHGGGGLALTALIVLHLILNWGWIKTSYFKKSKGA